MISISQGKQADVSVLDELILEPGAFYVMDRGYVDFARLYRFVLAGPFFVTRAKAGLQINRMTQMTRINKDLKTKRAANGTRLSSVKSVVRIPFSGSKSETGATPVPLYGQSPSYGQGTGPQPASSVFRTASKARCISAADA
jgi:hypothetical protein